MQQPLISIITVVLNGAATLEKAIRSVVYQKITDYEYIIVDGRSTDGSIEIIKKYESNITCWISEQDEGVYDAMNKAVALTRGKWIYFLGADDLLLDSFSKIVSYLKDEQTIYYGNVYRPFIARIYDGEFSAYKLACRNLCHQSAFYPRCIWNKYSFNLRYRVFADYDLNIRCFADPMIKFQYIPILVAIFTDEYGISPTKVDIVFENERLSIIKDAFPRWIFIIFSIRSFALRIINLLRLQKVALAGYHFFLRISSLKENNLIKKKYYNNNR